MTAADPRFREPAVLFWGIGAQKAGTTWLHRYLATHPQVCVPEVFKEQQYWNSVRPPRDAFILPKTPRGRLVERLKVETLPRIKRDARTREWAARQRAVLRPRADHRDHATALLAHWAGEHAVGEITPDYARLGTDSFAEMAALGRETRFFFLMRDPVERALSSARMHVRMHRRLGNVDRSADERIERALSGEDPHLLEYSDYARTIATLEAAVPPERIAYFFYETFFDQAEIDRLCAFLGVAPHPAPIDEVVFSFTEKEPATFSPDLVARLEERLAPVYAMVRDRFGDRVPEGWRRP